MSLYWKSAPERLFGMQIIDVTITGQRQNEVRSFTYASAGLPVFPCGKYKDVTDSSVL